MTGKEDVSNSVKMVNGKALPGGWSQYELQHDGETIGFVESGEIMLKNDDYSFEEKKEGDTRRIIIYKKFLELKV